MFARKERSSGALTWYWPDVGTEHSQEIDLFLTLSVGHVDDTVVSLAPADVGKSDTGVSRCTLDDSTSWSNEPLFLCLLDEVERSSVLD